MPTAGKLTLIYLPFTSHWSSLILTDNKSPMGEDSHIKGMRVLVGNFEKKP